MISHLEYANVILSPCTVTDIIAIERIQHRFLCYVSRLLGCSMHRFDHNYEPIFRQMDMYTLKNWRKIADLIFFHKIVNNTNECSLLSQLINFNDLTRVLRRTFVFRTIFIRIIQLSIHINVLNKPLNDFNRLIIRLVNSL